ncbi:MAG: ABC transporter ATP-binding protein [Rhodospirillaceae bacterium]|nr:ABC transporter ATP-binding protein [Rhodospirillaceae bacterium]MBT3884359.1 ABC transporter ATP-binding protein [Rhodospirillaceae bacterium]MBT4117097.1 ABC transporter ATP-binding protein [Rhodospirillaceae bacterium]MBT4672874.1 ABC transporter ATP-binding protein [Rhodospirillaceae bacterium]MBT4721031.1 ABC transporter ATP-binding protein [Rhodospirillaceae bacterium]
MTEPILKLTNLAKNFGGLVATDNLNFEVQPGELHAIIGPNGAGKTTLINQISGMMKPDGGQILFNGSDITHMSASRRCHAGLVRSFQITSILKNFSVAENVSLGIQARQGHSFKFWKPVKNDAALKEPVLKILSALGLGERAGVLAGNLAHGEQRQLEIAMALATAPKMLLLDEPMAGMGAEESEHMVKYLSGLKSQYTMLLIEHDMDAVFALADKITVLVYGQAIASGAPAEIRANEDVRRAYLGDD